VKVIWTSCVSGAPVIEGPRPPVDEPRAVDAAELAGLAGEAGITVVELCSPRRSKALVAARARVAKALRLRGLSYPEIGRLLGGRDHTTAMNLVKRRAG
jgi:hypothetical protein